MTVPGTPFDILCIGRPSSLADTSGYHAGLYEIERVRLECERFIDVVDLEVFGQPIELSPQP